MLYINLHILEFVTFIFFFYWYEIFLTFVRILELLTEKFLI